MGRAAAASAAPAQGFITLLSFNSAMVLPYAAQIQATDGNLYGTTPIGGAYDDGTVFRITPSGVLTTLHVSTGTTERTIAGLIRQEGILRDNLGRRGQQPWSYLQNRPLLAR